MITSHLPSKRRLIKLSTFNPTNNDMFFNMYSFCYLNLKKEKEKLDYFINYN